mmetsp:Transcript_26623/g.34586  ORF Transcript_26623/g.34586 Transcript_26623/m.34586 type:complete len:255 (-) Transcript_26623:85-849(-)
MYIIQHGLNDLCINQIEGDYKEKGEGGYIEVDVEVIRAYARYFEYDLTKKLTKVEYEHCSSGFYIDANASINSKCMDQASRLARCFDIDDLMERIIESKTADHMVNITRNIDHWKPSPIDIETYHDLRCGIFFCLIEIILILRDYAKFYNFELSQRKWTSTQFRLCLRTHLFDALNVSIALCESFVYSYFELHITGARYTDELLYDDCDILKQSEYIEVENQIRQKQLLLRKRSKLQMLKDQRSQLKSEKKKKN